ncbi:hypothetical protein CRG98_025514 [Punica granatum]|uniref:Uncharacterized protein n=1 Tax=Punica granatum TaxID=22663 RepID=A0A2I0JCY3_PUNGR|nr:hypothetical protein CRG98_025514 [Punica granatum]
MDENIRSWLLSTLFEQILEEHCKPPHNQVAEEEVVEMVSQTEGVVVEEVTTATTILVGGTIDSKVPSVTYLDGGTALVAMETLVAIMARLCMVMGNLPPLNIRQGLLTAFPRSMRVYWDMDLQPSSISCATQPDTTLFIVSIIAPKISPNLTISPLLR